MKLDRLVGVVLPLLDDVMQSEAEDWVRSAEDWARRKEMIHLSKEDILVEIRAIFQRWEAETSSARIPMESLTMELKKRHLSDAN